MFLYRILKAAPLLAFMMLISTVAYPRDNPTGMNIKLNPECKIKRLSNGSVIISSKNAEGRLENHQFTDFYADLLMAAYRNQKTDYIIDSFSKKYYLSKDECRREIKHALNVLSEWHIVLRGDKLAEKR